MGKKKNRAKAKQLIRKEKMELLVRGDIGQQTKAQMVDQRINEIMEENGAKSQQRIKDSHIAKMARPNGSRDSMITPLQAVAGIMYHDASLKTELTGEVAWARIFVDCNSGMGDMNPAKLDAVAKVREIEVVIPKDVRQLCRRVCLFEDSISRIAHGDNRRIGKLKIQLRRGLDAIVIEFRL